MRIRQFRNVCLLAILGSSIVSQVVFALESVRDDKLNEARKLRVSFCHEWPGNTPAGHHCMVGFDGDFGKIEVKKSDVFGNVCIGGVDNEFKLADGMKITGAVVHTPEMSIPYNRESLADKILVDTLLPDSPVVLADEFSDFTELYENRVCFDEGVECPSGDFIITDDFHIPAPQSPDDPIPLFIIKEGRLIIKNARVIADAGAIFYLPAKDSTHFPNSRAGDIRIETSDVENLMFSANKIAVLKSIVRGGQIFSGKAGTEIKVEDSVIMCEPEETVVPDEPQGRTTPDTRIDQDDPPHEATNTVNSQGRTNTDTNMYGLVPDESTTTDARSFGEEPQEVTTSTTDADNFRSPQGSMERKYRPARGCINGYAGFDADVGACAVLEISTEMLDIGGNRKKVEVRGDICVADNSRFRLGNGVEVPYGVILGQGVTLPVDIRPFVKYEDEILEVSDQSSRIQAVLSAEASIRGPCACDGSEPDIRITDEHEAKAFAASVGDGGTFCFGKMEILKETKVGPGDFRFNVCLVLKVQKAKFESRSGPTKLIFNVIGSGTAVTLTDSEIQGTILAKERKIAIARSKIKGQVMSGGPMKIVGHTTLDCPPAFWF